MLLDPNAHTYLYFAGEVNELITTHLLKTSENPICAIEIIAVVAAFWIWAKWLNGRPMIGFIDNEPAKHGLVKGTSQNEDCAAILNDIAVVEIRAQILAYWERVASDSNIADDPSRGIEPIGIPSWRPPTRTMLARASDLTGHWLKGIRDLHVQDR